MKYNISEEHDFLVDLESGETSCEEETNLLGTTLLDDSGDGDCSVSSNNCSSKSNEDLEILINNNSENHNDEHVHLVEEKNVKEKRKATKKALKPPRPPKGPLLDAADMKLVKEISELAMKKRARIEHMKALKKIKAAKSSSSSTSTLCAMFITLFFCLIIIFQGICSRNNSSASFQGSPEPAVPENSLISVQLYDNTLASNNIVASSDSPNSVEEVSSGSKFRSPG